MTPTDAHRLTEKQRRALVDLSDGEWHYLMIRSTSVKSWLYRHGLIRCDQDSLPYPDRMWTITPDGLAALEVSQ